MYKLLTPIALLIFPVLIHAQDSVNAGYIINLVNGVQGILNIVIPLVVTIAVILFFWGLAIFIFKADDEEERTKGRNIMIWGVVALFVIVAVWGLVGLLANIFGVEGGIGETQKIPGVIAPPAP